MPTPQPAYQSYPVEDNKHTVSGVTNPLTPKESEVGCALRSSSVVYRRQNNLRVKEEALFLVGLGQRVLPLEPDGKRPLLANGLRGASSHPDDIERWWAMWPNANLGMVVGDLLIIDDDNPKHGRSSKTAHLSAPCVKTPSGGTHHYYYSDGRRSRRINVGGVDLLTGYCYVLMPPSIVNGKRYEWIRGNSNLIADVVPPTPQEIRSVVGMRYVSVDQLDLSMCGIGNRNNSLYGLGARLLAFGYPENMVSTMLEYSASTMPGELENGEVDRIMHSLRGYKTRASASMWRSPLDRLSESEFDHKCALLLGVLRGADAGPLLMRACIYGMLCHCDVTFDLRQEWIEERVKRGMRYAPQGSHFLRRKGSSDRWWSHE